MMLSSGPIPKIKKKISHTTHTVKRALHLDSLVVKKDSIPGFESGRISFYGKKHNRRKTASGEIFNMNEYTAAHKYYPFGTMVRVTNSLNNKSVTLKINDRLPKSSLRMIDVSLKAAQDLGMVKRGLVKGELTVLEWGDSLSVKKHTVPSDTLKQEEITSR